MADNTATVTSGQSVSTPSNGGVGNSSPVAPAGNTGAGSSSDFINSLQNALFQSNGMVSSNASNLDTAIGTAVTGLQSAQDKTDAGLAAGHTSDVNAATTAGNNRMTAELEARRGMATNTGIVNNIQDTTNKNIADLDEKYQQAISTGDAATAGKIADLQVQALQMRQTATQQAFTNMLSIASTLNTAKSQQTAEDKQNFDEQAQIGQIGLQYGIPVTPGMTLPQMVSAAAPKASQEEQAKLGLMVANTQKAQADARLALTKAKTDVSPSNADAYASTVQNLVLQGRTQEASAYLQNIQSSQGDAAYRLVNDALTKQIQQQFDPNTMGVNFDQQFASGANFNDLAGNINDNPFATAAQKKTALGVLQDAQQRYNDKQVQRGAVNVFGKPVDRKSILGQIFG